MWFGLKVTRQAGVAALVTICFVVASLLVSTPSTQAVERIQPAAGTKVTTGNLDAHNATVSEAMAKNPEDDTLRILLSVGDTTGNPGLQNSAISVFLTNPHDTIAAFEIWLKLSRPDILAFQTDLDTVVDTSFWFCTDSLAGICTDSISCDPDSVPYWICTSYDGDSCTDSVFVEDCSLEYIDSTEVLVGNVDTTGSRIAGWRKVVSRSITGTPYDIKVTGQANVLGEPSRPYLPLGSGLFFRLRGDIFPISDTVEDRTAYVAPQYYLEHFNFSRPDGTSIGIVQVPYLDTSCFRCDDWLPPDSVQCLHYEKIPYCEGCCDSMTVEEAFAPQIDTNQVKMYDGSLTVNLTPPGACCLEDSCFIATGVDGCEILAGGVYKGNGTTCSPNNPCLTCCQGSARGNVDGLGDPSVPTLGDLSAMIDLLFISLEPPACPAEANVDAIGPDTPAGITLGDLSALIDALFISLEPPPPC